MPSLLHRRPLIGFGHQKRLRTAHAVSSGKCVWQQMLPFAEKFVAEKLEEVLASSMKTVNGIKGRINDILTSAIAASTKLPNGEIINRALRLCRGCRKTYMPSTRICQFLHGLQQDCVRILGAICIPAHQPGGNIDLQCQDPDCRVDLQEKVACYAMAICNPRDTQARMKSITHAIISSECMTRWCPTPHVWEDKSCYSKVYECRDGNARCSHNLPCWRTW